MAQQASPKLMGQREDFRAQFVTASRVVVRTFASNCRSRTLIIYSLASKGTPEASGMGSIARVITRCTLKSNGYPAHSDRARRTSTETIPGEIGRASCRERVLTDV